jgi:outer membrane protein assembly factor BamB
MRPPRAVLSLALFLSVACGGGGTGSGVFSTSWNDDGGKSIEALRKRLEGHVIPLGADIAVGVTGHSSKLIGQPLAGGAPWTYVHAIDALPIIAGSVVVSSGGGEVFALDAATGKVLWTRPTGGLPLHGAGDDGTLTVVTMGSPEGTGSTLLAVGHDGAVLRQIERPVALGAPAVVDHMAFVPWDNQYVSVIDVTDGSEVARALLRETTSHAWTVGGGLYFGELGIFRFDDTIKDGGRGKAAHLALPTKTMPGSPVLFRPGTEPHRAFAGAEDELRLYVRPTPPGQPLGMDDKRFYATYFRLAFGLSEGTTHVAWVHTHGPTIIGGAAAQGALVLCDAAGKVTTLDGKTGGVVGDVTDMGGPIESCTVQADGFHKAGVVASAGRLVDQVRTAVTDRDLELDSGQTLLLRQLGKVPDEAATDLLLELARSPHLSPKMVQEIHTAIANRRAGARSLIAALGTHYDFLHDVTSPPPVGPIAQALRAMNEASAAGPLAAQLLDPANSEKDVRDVAQALAVLATPAEVPTLLRFLALYHCAPAEPEEIPEAANAVAEALLRVGGKEGRAVIDAAVASPMTNAAVRAKLEALKDSQEALKHSP